MKEKKIRFRDFLLISNLRILYFHKIIFYAILLLGICLFVGFFFIHGNNEIYDGRIFNKYWNYKIFAVQAEKSDNVYFTSREGAFWYDKLSRTLNKFDIPNYYNASVPIKFYKKNNYLFLLFSDGSIYDLKKNKYLFLNDPVIFFDKSVYNILFEDDNFKYIGSSNNGALIENKTNGIIKPVIINSGFLAQDVKTAFGESLYEFINRFFPETGIYKTIIQDIKDSKFLSTREISDKIAYSIHSNGKDSETQKIFLNDIVDKSILTYSSTFLTPDKNEKSFLYNVIPQYFQNYKVNKISVVNDALFIGSSDGLHIFEKNGFPYHNKSFKNKFELFNFNRPVDNYGGIINFSINTGFGIAHTAKNRLFVNTPDNKNWEPLFSDSSYKDIENIKHAYYSIKSNVIIMSSTDSIGIYNVSLRNWITLGIGEEKNNLYFIDNVLFHNDFLYIIYHGKKEINHKTLIIADIPKLNEFIFSEKYTQNVDNFRYINLINLKDSKRGIIFKEYSDDSYPEKIIPSEDPLFLSKNKELIDLNMNMIFGKSAVIPDTISMNNLGNMKDCYYDGNVMNIFTDYGNLLTYDFSTRNLSFIHGGLTSYYKDKKFEFGIENSQVKKKAIKFFKFFGNEYINTYNENNGIDDFFIKDSLLYLITSEYINVLSLEKKSINSNNNEKNVASNHNLKSELFYSSADINDLDSPLFCTSGDGLYMFNVKSGKLYFYNKINHSWNEVKYSINGLKGVIKFKKVRYILGDNKNNISILFEGDIGNENYHSIVLNINIKSKTGFVEYRGNYINGLNNNIKKIAGNENDHQLVLSGNGSLVAYNNLTGYWQKIRDSGIKNFYADNDKLALISENNILSIYGYKDNLFQNESENYNDIQQILFFKSSYMFAKKNENDVYYYDFSKQKINESLFHSEINILNPKTINIEAIRNKESDVWHINEDKKSYYLYDVRKGNIYSCNKGSVHDNESEFFDAGNIINRVDNKKILYRYMLDEGNFIKFDPIPLNNYYHYTFMNSSNDMYGYLTLSELNRTDKSLHIYVHNVNYLKTFIGIDIKSIPASNNPVYTIPILNLTSEEWEAAELLTFNNYFLVGSEKYNAVLVLYDREYIINTETLQSIDLTKSLQAVSSEGNISQIKNDDVYYVNNKYYYINNRNMIEKCELLKGDYISRFIIKSRAKSHQGSIILKDQLKSIYSIFLHNHKNIIFNSINNDTYIIRNNNRALALKKSGSEYAFKFLNYYSGTYDNLINADKSYMNNGSVMFSFNISGNIISRELSKYNGSYKFSEDIVDGFISLDKKIILKSRNDFQSIETSPVFFRSKLNTFSMTDFEQARRQKTELERKNILEFVNYWFEQDNFINRGYISKLKNVNNNVEYIKINGQIEKNKNTIYELVDHAGMKILQIVNISENENIYSQINSDYVIKPWDGKRFFFDNTVMMKYIGNNLLVKFFDRGGMLKFVYAENLEKGNNNFTQHLSAGGVSRNNSTRYYKDTSGIFYIDAFLNKNPVKKMEKSILTREDIGIEFKKDLSNDSIKLYSNDTEIKNHFLNNRFIFDYIYDGGSIKINNENKLVFYNDKYIQVGTIKNGKFKSEGSDYNEFNNNKVLWYKDSLFMREANQINILKGINGKRLVWESAEISLDEIEKKDIININFKKDQSGPIITRSEIKKQNKNIYLINNEVPEKYIIENRFFFDYCDGISNIEIKNGTAFFMQHSGKYEITYKLKPDKSNSTQITELKKRNDIKSIDITYPKIDFSKNKSFEHVLFGRVLDIQYLIGDYLYCNTTKYRDSYARFSINDGSVKMVNISDLNENSKDENEFQPAQKFGWELKNNRIFSKM